MPRLGRLGDYQQVKVALTTCVVASMTAEKHDRLRIDRVDDPSDDLAYDLNIHLTHHDTPWEQTYDGLSIHRGATTTPASVSIRGHI